MQLIARLIFIPLTLCLFQVHAEDAKTAKKAPTEATKAEAPKAEKPAAVVMETSMGTVEIELDAKAAPISTKNFLSYVEKKQYDKTIFHRVIKDFMIQGGGFDEKMVEKQTDAPIKNEAGNGLKNDRGTIAMARTSDVNSASAQFYINVVDNPNLNHKNESDSGFGYAVFGKVTKGMDVVDKIRAVATGERDVPNSVVLIKSIRKKK